jgi:hypothetical protein
MDENTAGLLATRLFEKICAVCVDRNVDGSCNRLSEGTCTLLTKLPQAAEAILKVSSDRIDPYIEAIRKEVCLHCDLRNPDGTCAPRDTDQCMLDTYLPFFVEVIESHFQRPCRDLTPRAGVNT